MLSFDVIIWDDNIPFLIFPENVTHSLSVQPASLRCLPFGSKLLQGIATMTYTRSHTRPSQKNLGGVVYPLNNKSLVQTLGCCGGEGGDSGVSANLYGCAHGAQINFGDLTPCPYLTCAQGDQDFFPQATVFTNPSLSQLNLSWLLSPCRLVKTAASVQGYNVAESKSKKIFSFFKCTVQKGNFFSFKCT